MNINVSYIANATYLMVQDNRAYAAGTTEYTPADQAEQKTAAKTVNGQERFLPKRPFEQPTTPGHPQEAETSTSPGESGREESDNAAGTTGSIVNDSVQLSDEVLKIKELQGRDQEVRAHEAAHASVGGQLLTAATNAPSQSRNPEKQKQIRNLITAYQSIASNMQPSAISGSHINLII